MSGGSYDYFFHRVDDMANRIGLEHERTRLVRTAFKAHLSKVAEACRAIEWVDSGDSSPGDEVKAIETCLGWEGPAIILSEAIRQADVARGQLEEVLAMAKEVSK